MSTRAQPLSQCRCPACCAQRRARRRSLVHTQVRCPQCGAGTRTTATLLTHAVYCEERQRVFADAAIDHDAPRLRRQRRG